MKLGLVLALAAWQAAAFALDLVETPMLAEEVAAKKTPPVRERLPEAPLIVQLDGKAAQPGHHGGTLHMLIGRSRDVRMLVVYGYSRLVGYDRDLRIVPDLLESFAVDEGRVFALKLRKGHRWSDGAPFTTEDFRYYWEDVATNKELSPAGPPGELAPDGELPKV